MCRTLLNLAKLDSVDITAIAISSVVPALNFTLHKMAQTYFDLEPLFVTSMNAAARSSRIV